MRIIAISLLAAVCDIMLICASSSVSADSSALGTAPNDEFTADRVIQLKSYLASTGCSDNASCQQDLDKLPLEEDDIFEKVARCQVLGGGKYVSGGCYHLVGNN